MKSVADIEDALRQLPRSQTWEVPSWLMNYLEKDDSPVCGDQSLETVTLPDYAAHRRSVFGDLVLPNMVLVARDQERW